VIIGRHNVDVPKHVAFELALWVILEETKAPFKAAGDNNLIIGGDKMQRIPRDLLALLFIAYLFVWLVFFVTDSFKGASLLAILGVLHIVFLIFAGFIVVFYLLAPLGDITWKRR